MDLFKRAFEGIIDKLVDEIDVGHGLWKKLEALKVLTDRQIRDCTSEVCHSLLITE